MTRVPLISGNWKMNMNHFEAIQLVQKLGYALAKHDFEKVNVTVHPPFTDIRSVQTVIDADRMRANLDITNGMIVSEAVMMGLAPYMGRQVAHDVVYDVCRDAMAQDRPLRELLCELPEITKHLTAEQVSDLCDPAGYVGQAGEMVDRMLARVATTKR